MGDYKEELSYWYGIVFLANAMLEANGEKLAGKEVVVSGLVMLLGERYKLNELELK